MDIAAAEKYLIGPARPQAGTLDIAAFGGPVWVRWDQGARVTHWGGMAYFATFLLGSGLFDRLVADTLKKHLYGLLAWFDSRIDNALTEGFNATIQSLKATAKGFRNFENFRIAVLFYCGKLDMRPDFVRVGSTFGITDEGEFFH